MICHFYALWEVTHPLSMYPNFRYLYNIIIIKLIKINYINN